LDQAISSFLSERKADRIKKKLKATMTDGEKNTVEQDAQNEFMLDNWLPNAARRAGQLSMVSHPGKFSHPSAQISNIIASIEYFADGFLRTGNTKASLDVLGNAAAIDVYKFLSLVLSDEKTVLDHLEEASPYIHEQLKIKTSSFETIRGGLLAIKNNAETAMTSGKVKQVYFPNADGYHLISILTPSGLMFNLRKRIDLIRFSPQTKEARDARKKQIYNEQGFDELFNLTIIGYGGTKPQNISVLNNQNGGKTYLLPSMPPSLMHRSIQPPKRSFFTNTIRPKQFTYQFFDLHKLIVLDYNNKNIREGRDKLIQSIIDQVIVSMWNVRLLEPGWSNSVRYMQLPAAQKTWLDSANEDERDKSDEWLNEIIHEFSRWIIQSYKKVIGDQARMLGDVELSHIRTIIEQNREGLR